PRTKRRKRRVWAIRRTGLRVRAGALRARGHEEAGLRRGVHRGLRQYVRCGRALHILLSRPLGEPMISTVRDLLSVAEDRLSGHSAGPVGEGHPKAVMRFRERRSLGPETGGHFEPESAASSKTMSAPVSGRPAPLSEAPFVSFMNRAAMKPMRQAP